MTVAPNRSLVDDVTLVIRRLLVDDSAQDLIEYALLAALVVASGIALFPVIEGRMSNAYSAWDSGTYNLWIPADPLP